MSSIGTGRLAGNGRDFALELLEFQHKASARFGGGAVSFNDPSRSV